MGLLFSCLGASIAQDFKVGTQLVYSHPSVTLDPRVGNTVQFAPRTEARPGVEMRYRNYGFSFSTSLSEATDGVPEFIAGGFADFRTYFHGQAWGVEAYHRRVRGFYAQVEDSGGAEVPHPSMTLRANSVTLYRAMDSQSRVYRLSEGLVTPGMEPDFMWTFALSQNRLRDVVPFLTGTGISGSRFDDLRDMNLYSASMGAGFSISTNAGGLYFDPALFAGFGMQYREWDGRSETAWNLVKVNLRMRLGYRSRWFDVGAGFENDAHAALADEETAIFNALVARAIAQVYF
jgi:hypothetical protein